jgi:DNA modification methylase
MAELIWDGKYDEHGHKRAPVRIELPFQTVETVNESAQDRQRTLELSSSGNDPEWRNRLIWGDKKYVLPSLLPEFAGKVDLIYIDPPYDTGSDFSFVTAIPGSDDTFIKEPSMLEQKAYRDTWGRGLDSYLEWFHESAVLLRELLSDTGSMYVHLDWRVGHYAKGVLDEVFGVDNFRNEIVWQRDAVGKGAKKSANQWSRELEQILYYSKSGSAAFQQLYKSSDDLTHTQLKEFRYHDSDGRQFKIVTLGDYSEASIDSMRAKGLIYKSSTGTEYKKYYLDEFQLVIGSLWNDIPNLSHGLNPERCGYPTQKPEALLSRIMKSSSSDNDLVMDCFCGSGTTAVAAEKLNRRWIACDLGRFAIHTTRKRLLGISGVKPFVVQNLGKYERQAWQVAEFADTSSDLSSRAKSRDPMPAGSQQKRGEEFAAPDRGENALTGRSSLQAGKGSFDSRTRFASGSRSSAQDDRVRGGAQDDRAAGDRRLREQREREAAYRKFILELYHATPVTGHVWLHGVKGGRMVHVGAVDAPVTRADVNAIAAEVWKSKSAGTPSVDILGWEFALELNETAKEVAAQARVNAAFKKIPREVLEKKAVEQGDVHFFELGALSVETKIKKRELTLKLSDFVIPLDDVPEEVRPAIKHWSQMVDYWAVDWDFKDDTFHTSGSPIARARTRSWSCRKSTNTLNPGNIWW